MIGVLSLSIFTLFSFPDATSAQKRKSAAKPQATPKPRTDSAGEPKESARTILVAAAQSNPLVLKCGAADPTFPGAKSVACDPAKQALACFRLFNEGADSGIAADFSNWRPISGLDLKLKGACFALPKAARIEYKYIIGERWLPDLLNPNKIEDGLGGENSWFAMPDYKPTVWDKGEAAAIKTIEIKSNVFGERRNVGVYLPPLSKPAKPDSQLAELPVMYLLDGSDYATRARAAQAQKNLVKAGKVKPFIMVFVDFGDRMAEGKAGTNFAQFLATEVVPAIDGTYSTAANRQGRAVMGASLGGVSAVWAAMKYPEVFGRVGGQSTSWWVDEERVIKKMEYLDTRFTFYFDAGTLEPLEIHRRAVDTLRKKGYVVTYQETDAGHNWTAWRDRLADAFVALWK